VLIIVAATFFLQYRYMVNYDIGLERENIITFTSFDLRSKHEAVVEKLEQYPDVVDVTATISPITATNSRWGREYEGKDFMLHVWNVRWNMPQFFGIKVVEGEGFTKQSGNRRDMMVSMNLRTEIGIPVGYDKLGSYKVTAVAKGVRLNAVTNDNIYTAFCCNAKQALSTFYIKLREGADIRDFAVYIKDLVQEFAPGADEPEVEFFDQAVANLYNSTKKATVTIGLFALLAVVIALMGVFGIVMFETQHRRSEIAIRKVYGAERGQMIGLLNNQYVGLVLASFIVAAPIAWWIVQRWLEQFANRIAMPWWIFAVALVAVLAVTVTLVSLRSWKAASENPVDVVRM
ncbi:MAG: FtsX-like permease family protein, partial [Bacteroidales bacterium]|nr:FtsX-like permease family protein [Bacteroidales bacterium]